MAEMMLVAAATAAVGTLVGSELSASGMEDAAEVKAAGLRQAATESRASSQRQAMEQRRRARLALSTLTARAAAGGGSATDPGVVRLGGDIAARGEYQALAEMYTGENRARGLETEANIGIASARQQAHATRVGSYFKAAGTILSGVGGYMKPGGGSLPGEPLDIRSDAARYG